MLRLIFAACLLIACSAASSVCAAAAYRVEHTYAGNSDVRKDRLYVRDAKSGKRLVLSRHWGAKCNRLSALNYALEGGCWYPVRESYPAWRRHGQGWFRPDLIISKAILVRAATVNAARLNRRSPQKLKIMRESAYKNANEKVR